MIHDASLPGGEWAGDELIILSCECTHLTTKLGALLPPSLEDVACVPLLAGGGTLPIDLYQSVKLI
jgi:hypothetical protein